MFSMKPVSYIFHTELVCDLSDQNKNVLRYRHLKLLVMQEIVTEKVHLVMSFKQKARLDLLITLKTTKRAVTENKFDWGFQTFLNIASYGETKNFC